MGRWVTQQKQFYTNKKLSAERIAQLEAIKGWKWADKKNTHPFKTYLSCLKTHVSIEGHARVRQGFKTTEAYPERDVNLGRWVTQQKQDYRRKKLSAEKIAQLEAIKGWFWG